MKKPDPKGPIIITNLPGLEQLNNWPTLASLADRAAEMAAAVSQAAYPTRTFDRRAYRVHLVNSTGRSIGALRYLDGKADWPLGPVSQGDRFTRDQAFAEEAQWTEALANKGTGLRALAWRIEDEPAA